MHRSPPHFLYAPVYMYTTFPWSIACVPQDRHFLQMWLHWHSLHHMFHIHSVSQPNRIIQFREENKKKSDLYFVFFGNEILWWINFSLGWNKASLSLDKYLEKREIFKFCFVKLFSKG